MSEKGRIKYLEKVIDLHNQQHKKLSNRIAEMKQIEKRWIPVQEATPTTTGYVLAFGGGEPVIGRYENGKWHARDTDYESGEPWLCEPGTVTHWMPLPADPNEECERGEL